MRNKYLRYFFFIILPLLSLLVIISPKLASAQILFQDEFSSTTNENWDSFIPPSARPNGSSWVFNGSEYVGTAAIDTFGQKLIHFALAGDPTWTNYRYEVKVTSVTSLDKIIYFHCNGYLNCYKLAIRNYGLLGGNMVDLSLVTGISTDNTTLIKQVPFENGLGITYKIAVEARNIIGGGLSIKVFVNDVFLFDQYLAPDEYPIPDGRIGLGVYPGGGTDGTSITKFDDVVVTAMEMATPTPTPSPTPKPTIAPTATPIPTVTPTPSPTLVPTPEPTATSTLIPTPTPELITIDKLIRDIEMSEKQNLIPCDLYYWQLKVQAILAKLFLCKGKTSDAKTTLKYMRASLNAVDQRFILNGAKKLLLTDLNYLISSLP